MNTSVTEILLVLLAMGFQGEAQLYEQYFSNTLQSQPKQENFYGLRRDARQSMDYPELMRLLQQSFASYQKSQDLNRKIGNNYRTIDDSHYETSHSVNFLGNGQIETVKSEHRHSKVPAFDVSDFEHGHQEKHGEVHYHHHKHIHKHDHKQDHVHQHKNQHQHKHMHHQDHKHKHHEEHKHGHDHKHDHHENHKNSHQHKHSEEHKHGHHHGHKHMDKHGYGY